MAKFTKAQQRQKILHAKDLYIKGFDYPTISDILNVSETTLAKWGRENDFESAKQSSFIALSEIRNTILQSFADLKDGKKPKISPDQAAKYAAAFEKLSDKRKTLTYMYEAFEQLTTEFIKDLQLSAGKTQRDATMQILRDVRDKMDKVISNLTTQVLNDKV